MRTRAGFTMLEVLIVLVLAGVVGAMVVPSINRSMAQMRLQRAASVIAGELQLAHAAASRQRLPVRIAIDTVNKVVRVRDQAVGTRVYTERRFDRSSEYPVSNMRVTPDTSLVVLPNGLATDTLRIVLWAGGKSRTIRMSRAGQVRISQ